MKIGVLGACALLLCSTAANAASPTYFQACDGYGSPTKGGDGMTKEATALFGLIATLGSAGNTRRSTPALGSAGVIACDQALADVRLIDKHWLRRASLLRARALHDLAASQPDEALNDLDRAVATVREPNDPFVKRSMLLGIDFVRGYALALKGDRAGATRLITQVQAQRPFDRALALASLAILGDDHALVGQKPLTEEVARLDPRLIDIIFQSAFDRGEFDKVIIIHPHLKAPVRSGDIGVDRWAERIQDARKDAEELAFAADRGGRLAYAWAALGRPDEAKAALARARAELAAATPSVLPPPPAGEKEGTSARIKRNLNDQVIRASLTANSRLDTWAKFVALRSEIVGLAPDAAKERILAEKVPAAGVGLDLLKLMKTKTPDDPGLQSVIAQYQARLDMPSPITPKEAPLVFKALPHTELASRVATYRKANSDFVGYLWGGISGFKTKPDASDPNRVTVQFTGEKSSGSVVEEMTLLRAADYAREHGKSGFVILERRDYERTVNTTYYGATLRSDPAGYTTYLDIELVDAAHLPEPYGKVGWRVIPVAEVVTQLGPLYMAAPTTVAAGGSSE
jgi:hypothetical protein